jgi:hypothetical protein
MEPVPKLDELPGVTRRSVNGSSGGSAASPDPSGVDGAGAFRWRIGLGDELRVMWIGCGLR